MGKLLCDLEDLLYFLLSSELPIQCAKKFPNSDWKLILLADNLFSFKSSFTIYMCMYKYCSGGSVLNSQNLLSILIARSA